MSDVPLPVLPCEANGEDRSETGASLGYLLSNKNSSKDIGLTANIQTNCHNLGEACHA
jgi:hypothetical protein